MEGANPKYVWPGHSRTSAFVRKVNGSGHKDKWNIGRRTGVQTGQPAMLIRVGRSSPGIVLSGFTGNGSVRKPAVGPRYVDVTWNRGVDWTIYPPLPLESVLPQRRARQLRLSLQQSGFPVEGEDAARLWTAWERHVRYYGGPAARQAPGPRLEPAELEAEEGGQAIRRGKGRVRAGVWRKRLVTSTTVCAACGQGPPTGFGDDGLRIFEIHHLESLSQGPRITKSSHLVVLCRNCHALAHTEDPPMLPSAVKRRLQASSKR